MRRILLKIALLMLTCTLGVGVSVGWHLYQWSLEPYEVNPIPPWPLGTERPHLTNVDKITIVGGIDACGAEANFHTIDLSDGTRISQSCERFASPLAAERALKNRLGNAQIAERSSERDESGVAGEEILATGSRVMRLRLYGNSLCVTEAQSLRHLLLYEAGALHHGPGNSGNE